MSAQETAAVRVLLVEDDPDLAEVTAEFLRSENLDVRTAVSGREALEVAPAFLPQLILCDLNLPDISGLELVRELRSNSWAAHSYIVLLTAMAGMAQAGRALREKGVDATISKPLTIETVRSMVEDIGRRGLR
jgi:CheY-like chemotaxis protein